MLSLAPTRSAQPHVSYVLLAEFDIDEGSILKHQYPAATGVDEHLLAEHMLPDGAHDRTDDWTVFYLNQIPALTVDPTLLNGVQLTVEEEGKARVGSEGSRSDGSGLLYVVSLVRTKKVATVRRGALVKALAIATHNPYIQIYKPILLLALEDYFSDPSIACLSRLYASLNAMDTAHLPYLSLDERLILRTSERKDIFSEKFSDAESNSLLPTSPSNQSLYGNGDSNVGSEVLETSDRRSVSSGSLSSRTSKDARALADLPRTASSDGRGGRWSSGNTVEEVVTEGSFVDAATTGSLPRSNRPKDTHWFDTKIFYSGHSLNIRVPLGTFPEEIGDYSLIKLVQIFSNPTALSTTGPLHAHLHTSGHATHPIILLYNALVTHKRVVFLGHGQPAGHVANLVLAACALGSGCGSVLRGFTERTFPYTNLANLDNLQTVPGFIAGVCNPAFADRPGWWDVLCNIETGKIVISKEIQPVAPSARPFAPTSMRSQAPESSSFTTGEESEFGKLPSPSTGLTGGRVDGKGDSPDNVFMDEIMTTIAAHYGEAVIRARFTDYAQRFVRFASRHEEDITGTTTIGYPCQYFTSGQLPVLGTLGSGVVSVDESTRARDMAVNLGRMDGWRLTPSYVLYQRSFQVRMEESPLRGFDLQHQLTRLRQGRKMPAAEVELIYRTLNERAQTDEQIVAILAHLPPHFGGLLPLGFGLFHPADEIRRLTVQFLDTVNLHPTGQMFVHSLNAFHRCAYRRQSLARSEGRP